MKAGPSIRTFLLDRLSSEERDCFETELFEGLSTGADGFLDLVREEEDLLLDQYLLGELPADQRASLEMRLACSAQLQERLRFRGRLFSALRSGSAAPQVQVRASRGLLVLRLVACCSLAASILFAVLWFQTRRNFEHAQGQLNRAAISTYSLRPSPASDVNGASSPIFIAAINTRSSSEIPVFFVPEGQPVTEIQVQLSHHPNDSAKFGIVLRREGVLVLQLSEVKPRSVQAVDYLSVYIDTETLDAGTYELRTVGNADVTDQRFFRVSRSH